MPEPPLSVVSPGETDVKTIMVCPIRARPPLFSLGIRQGALPGTGPAGHDLSANTLLMGPGTEGPTLPGTGGNFKP